MNPTLSIEIRILVAQARTAITQLQGMLRGNWFGGATTGANGFGVALGRLNLASFGSRLQWIGRQIEYNFTLPIVAAATAAAKFALDNEAALVRVQKVYGDGSQSAAQMANEINALSKAFVVLSDEFGVAQSDVINIAADWAAAGVSGVALAKSVQLTLQTMILGEQSAADATQSLISIQAQYGLSIAQLTDTIDLLNMVENQTAVSMTGLIQAFTRTAGVAASSGVSVRYLAADIAALTPTAGTAVTVGNALKTIFSRLDAPTAKIASTLKLIGVNTASMSYQQANGQQKLLMVAGAFDKLSDSQKNYVATQIAGVYQLNRFVTLMDQLNSKTGYYAKALNSTTSQTKIYQQAQKELNQVLTSDPQRLKEIWVTLQNAMADIVQPLIPLILYLAQSLEKLVTSFSNLNPAVQKFILFGLAALALVGPIVRYLGAFTTLIAEVGAGLAFVADSGVGLLGFLARLVAFPVATFWDVFQFGMLRFGALLQTLPGIWTGILILINRATALFGVVFDALWDGFLNFAIFGMQASGRVIVTMWDAVLAAMEGATLLAAGWLGRTQRAMFAALEAMMLNFAAAAGRIWAIIAGGPRVLLTAMWTGIRAIFVGGLGFLADVGEAIVAIFTSPWILLIAAVVALVIIFWNDIKKIFSNAISWFKTNFVELANAFKPLADAANAVKDLVIRAFNALPAGIQSAMIAVVNTVAAAAQAVYKWFSYINPFARHSPSLVDNVTAGVAVIKQQYASLGNVGTAFKAAKSDLDLFGEAVAKVEHAAEANHYEEIRKEIIAVAKDALPYYDALVKQLYPLESQLAAVSKQLAAQQAVVDNLKDSLDAANDALSAQQDILDNMKDAVDGFSDKVNAINGDIETLSGIQKSLREAGAGSDILSGYDDQINALKDQKKGIDDQLTAAEAAYTKQQALVESLTAARDALQASYDKENASLQLIQKNYDAINDKIQAITGAINDFDSAAQSLANAAKKTGSGSGGLPGAANYGDVTGGGKLGREMANIPDQSSMIDAFTKQLQGGLSKMFGGFSILGPIKKAWNAATKWLGTTFGPLGHVIGSGFSSIFSNLPNPFKSIHVSGYVDAFKSIFGFVGTFFSNLWKQIGPPLEKIAGIIGGAFVKAWKQISPEIAKFKDLIGPIGQLFKELAPILEIIGGIVGGVLVGAIIILVKVLENTLKPILDVIIDVITAVIKILRGLIEFLVGVFTGNWKLAWQGIKDFFGGIWEGIWSIIKNAGLIIWGVVKGIVEGIWDFFKWIYDELLGHSIIPDIVNGVIFYFNLMKDTVVAIWDAFIDLLKAAWHDVLLPIFDAIKNVVLGIIDVFKMVVAAVTGNWNAFINAAKDAYGHIKSVIADIGKVIANIGSFFKSAYDTVTGYISKLVSAFTGIPGKISKVASSMWDGMKNSAKSVFNAIASIWNSTVGKVSFHIPSWVPGIGGDGFSFPKMPTFAQGGAIYNRATAIVGEGRPGYPEYVIPTDPLYRDRATILFKALASQLGASAMNAPVNLSDIARVLNTNGGTRTSLFASGGILGRASFRSTGGSAILVASHQEHNEYHFHGDLSFPNIKTSDDADKFIKNLRSLVGS